MSEQMEIFLAVFLQEFAPGVIGGISYFVYQKTENKEVDFKHLLAYIFLGGVVGYISYFALSVFLARIIERVPDLIGFENEFLRAITGLVGFLFKPFIKLIEGLAELLSVVIPNYISNFLKKFIGK